MLPREWNTRLTKDGLELGLTDGLEVGSSLGAEVGVWIEKERVS